MIRKVKADRHDLQKKGELDEGEQDAQSQSCAQTAMNAQQARIATLAQVFGRMSLHCQSSQRALERDRARMRWSHLLRFAGPSKALFASSLAMKDS